MDEEKKLNPGEKEVAYLDYFKNVYVTAKEKSVDMPLVIKLFTNKIEDINNERFFREKIYEAKPGDSDPIFLKKVQTFLRRAKDLNEDNEVFFRSEWGNGGEKEISSISFEVACKNMYGNHLLTIKNIELDCGLDLKNAAKYGIQICDDIASLTIVLKKVIFDDDSVWEGNKEFDVDIIKEEERAFAFYGLYHSEPKEDK